MKSPAYSARVFGLLRHRQTSLTSGPAERGEDWAMLKLLSWAATVGVLAFLIWQTSVAAPLWPPAISAFLLVVVGVLAGLRMGTDSASAYTADLQRLNKVIAEQNRALEEANEILLKRSGSESRSPSKSA